MAFKTSIGRSLLTAFLALAIAFLTPLQAAAVSFAGKGLGQGSPVLPTLPESPIPAPAAGSIETLPPASAAVPTPPAQPGLPASAEAAAEPLKPVVEGVAPELQAISRPDASPEASAGSAENISAVLEGRKASSAAAQEGAEPGGLAGVPLEALEAGAASSAAAPAQRRAAVVEIARRGGEPAKAALERLGAYDPAGSSADYEVKRQALRALKGLGKTVSLPPMSRAHADEMLAELASGRFQAAAWDKDWTLEARGVPASRETAEMLKATSSAGVETMLLTNQGQESILSQLSTLTAEEKSSLSVGASRGAQLLVFDKEGSARLIRSEPGWTQRERAGLAQSALVVARRHSTSAVEGRVTRLDDYHFVLFLPLGAKPARVEAAAAQMQAELKARGLELSVYPRPSRGPEDPPYLAVSKYDKSLGARLLRQRPSRGLAGPDIPGSRTLLVGDHFFGPGNVDGDMPRGAPGATVLAVGGLADPDLDNAFVWPAQGHQAAMEIGRALAAVKPVEQAPVEEPPISAEAKRAIKGFSWARTFSIAASALYMIAFSALAVDHVGRQTFATINTFSSLVAIPLAFINGTLVDKLTPRQILIGGALVLAGVGAAAAALTAAGLINIWTLVPLTILLQMMQIAIVVGEGSLVPKVLGGNQKGILRVNALFDLIFGAVSTVASLAGAYLVSHVLGRAGAFLTYAAVQALIVLPIYLRFMPKGEAKPAETASRPAAKPGFGEAFRILGRSPFLIGLLGLSLAGIFLVFPLRLTMTPVIVKDYLHGSDALLGLMNTAIFSGMTVASLFNTFLAPRFSSKKLLFWSALAFPAFAILAAAPFSGAALFAGLALIFAIQTVGANVLRSLYMTEVQAENPKYMGRMMGISSSMYGLAIAGGTLLLKWVMGAASYPALLWYVLAPYALATGLFFLAPRLLRKAWGKSHPDGKKGPI